MFSNRKLLLFINRVLYIGAVAMLVAGLILTVTPQETSAVGSGSVWTTKNGCNPDDQQDVNHYAIGEWVYINGRGFSVNVALPWSIKGNPGGSSGDPKITVASGSILSDGTGSFCIMAYQVKADDWGEYTIDVDGKNDNYRVEASSTQEPTQEPTEDPTQEPTEDPTQEPTEDPTQEPTEDPTQEPTEDPTQEPTEDPIGGPDPTSTPVPEYNPPAVASVESVAVLIPVTGMDLNTGMNDLTFGGFGLLGLGLVMSGIRRKFDL